MSHWPEEGETLCPTGTWTPISVWQCDPPITYTYNPDRRGFSRTPLNPQPLNSPPNTHTRELGGKKSHPPAEEISIQSILSHIYISFSLYLLTSVTHLKCHRDQNRAAFWWNSWQSYTRYKTRGLCLLIHHTINFSSIFYIQRATLSGKKIKKKNKKTR